MEGTIFILGGGAGPEDRSERVRALLASAEGIRWRTAEGPSGIRNAARDAAAEGFRTIVAVGGDGTLGEVVNGAAGRLDDVEVGFVPAGSGNDFARNFSPEPDAAAALRAFLEGRAEPAGPRLAVNGVNGGFGALVGQAATADLKDLLGSWAYALSAGKAIIEMEEHRLAVTADGEGLEARAVGFLVMNGRTVGGGIEVTPGADPSDGLLDLVVVPGLDPVGLSVLAAALLSGRAAEQRELVRRRAREIRVEADPPAAFTTDGNPTGSTPAGFRVRPGALRLRRAPARSGGGSTAAARDPGAG